MTGNINLYPRGMYPKKVVYCVSDFTQWINKNFNNMISKVWWRHLNEFKGVECLSGKKKLYFLSSVPCSIRLEANIAIPPTKMSESLLTKGLVKKKFIHFNIYNLREWFALIK